MSIPIQVTILGSRGSMPVCGESFLRYGGATCCVLVQHDNQAYILDAGTGLLETSRYLHGESSLSLLLTHPHFDHIAGLPLFPEAFRKGFPIRVYGAELDGRDTETQIGVLMSPPLWPVGPHQLPADITFHPMEERFLLNGALVESLDGKHPGGVTILRLTVGGKQIVLLTDCTITEENRAELLDFCRGCDLLLCDGQYSDEEWPTRSTFGHNTWSEAARFALDCGAKCTRILHHDPFHTDDILDAARIQVSSICPACDLARAGEEITL